MNTEELAQILASYGRDGRIMEQLGKLYIWEKKSEGIYERKFICEIKK